jgi:tetratricopeptide (TPR) repeat protein
MNRFPMRAALLAAASLSSIVLARPALARTAEPAALDVQARSLADVALGQDRRICEAPMIGQVAAVTDAAGFDRLDLDLREVLLQVRMNCAQRAGDRPTATAAARRLTGAEFQPEVRGQAALKVALADIAKSDTRSFAEHIRIVLDTTPDEAVALPLQLYAFALGDPNPDPAAPAAFITALRRAPWTTEEAHRKVDNDWALREAVLAADAGDMTLASAALSRASEPAVLMAVYQDRRFERLWPEMEAAGRFDWRGQETARLAKIDERIAREPRRLELVVERIQALRHLERYQEARAVGADYAERLKRDNAFDDQKQQKAWVLYAYASVLDDLGETAPADAALVTAADGPDKISQHVNRAAALLGQGRAAEALSSLDKIPAGYGTPYGRMVTASNRLCALALLDRRQDAEAELPRLTPNWRDSPGAAISGLACLQRDDEAAALLVRWLEDPALRGEALAWFRTGRQPPGAAAAAARTPPLLRRSSALKSRPEVQAALAKVGRPLAYDLASQYGG